MKQIKSGALAIAIAALCVASVEAAQYSNVVGYNRVVALGNSDAVVSAPFNNSVGIKTLDQMFSGNLVGLSFIASTSPTAGGRKTEVLVPDSAGVLINKSPAATYYYLNSAWRKQGAAATINFGPSNLVSSATYVIVRNKNNGTALEVLTGGEVDPGSQTQAIATAAVRNDIYVASGRAATITLDDLQLGGGAAFVASTSPTAGGRKDELLKYNNAAAGQNKSPAETYYYFNNAWRKQGAASTLDFGSSNVVELATGLIIRKQSGTPGSANWTGIAPY